MKTCLGKYCFLLSFLICVLTGSAFAAICPKSDLNGDCMVNMTDLRIFALQWLDPESCEEDTCADYRDPYGIDFIDFSLLASEWQTGIPLVINEFMASNNSASGIHDPCGDYDDWIEIYNFGDANIDLGGMYLTDNLSKPTKWKIPTGYSSQTTVPAKGFVVFWADDETGQGPLHTNFKLSADGEEIGLFDSDGNTAIDTIVFGPQTANISYGRYPDATENWQFLSAPSPGATNGGTYLGEIDNVEFSQPHGFYSSSSPFTLTIACPTSGVNIYYTTDGRSPISGEVNTPTSIRYTTPITVSSTKCVRAAAIKTAWRPSPVATNTYIFDANSYHKALPIVSLVGDPNQTFFEPNGVMAIVGGYYASDGTWQSGGAGTYNNPMHRGMAYERPVSFEIFDANATRDVQSNGGIRVHGSDYTRPRYTRGNDWLTCYYNWWPNWNGNKFSLNLYFRSDYGNSRLDYLFFPLTPEVQSLHGVVLRAGHNDLCTPFVKDEWMRRLFKEMGGTQETGTFANLYINGVYKAYYNPTGHADNEFYQEWYGTNNDFDVITQSGVRDGDATAWNNFISYVTTHDLSNATYYNYVAGTFDITQFVDYLVLQIYSSNFDWPANNYTVHRERTDGAKFRYSIWDAEGIETWVAENHMDVNAFEDLPNWTSPTGLNHLTGDSISLIYRALKANPEFKQLFADRIHKHFRNGGILTKDHLLAKWWAVQGEVSPVLPYLGYPANFIPNTFIPNREDPILGVFEQQGLFNRSLGAPVFYVNGSAKFGGYVTSSNSFTMTDPCSSGGTIYYTTDGSDPRTPYTAAVSGTATPYTGSFTLNKSTDLKARIYKSSTAKWSSLNEAVYAFADVCNATRVTEIMYHPTESGPNDANTEYIELKNISGSTINLNLAKFDKGIDFTFGPNTLAAGQYILVVKDINAFQTKYGTGRYIAGQYSGSLDNAGERIRLLDALGTTILDFNYSDGWRSNTDGDGYSLTIINPANADLNSWGRKDSWRASAYIKGSPGWDDSNIIPNPGAIVINEVMSHSHAEAPDWIELYNTTANSINIGGWFLSDNDEDLMKYRFATGTTIPAYGYLVLTEDANFGASATDPGRLTPFSLSENGESVCLASALDANSLLTGYRAKEDFGAAETGVSFGRYYKTSTKTYDFVAMDHNTPAQANAYPKVGPIVISEIMYDPNWPTGGSYTNNEYEYVELLNITGSSVTLYDSNVSSPWKFTDGIDYNFALLRMP